MSEWDDYDPHKKRQQQLLKPDAAESLIAAERRLIAAMGKNPIDHAGLHTALRDDASPDRIVVNGFPALHVALGKRDIKAMEMLLRFGARTDDVNAGCRNALDEAYRLNFKEGIKLLKREGAELYRLKEDHSPFDDPYQPSYPSRINGHLFQMLQKGTAEQIRQALDLGADPNALDRSRSPSFTPVQVAAAWVDLEKVKILVERGADVTQLSTHGRDIIDVLWTAGSKALTPPWVEVFDYIHAQGYSNLFTRHPSQLTFDDLLEPVLTGGKQNPTRLHYLVAHGHAEKVLDILERSPGRRLAATDLLRREAYYNNETLLKAFAAQNQLSRIFTSAVWQGRVEEMMSLQPAIERDFTMKDKVDFGKARAEVMGQRLRELKSRAGNLKLK